MSDIILSKGVRSNLISLQQTADLIAQTQTRLSTGKKVNSALDNPINFFTASALNNRASEQRPDPQDRAEEREILPGHEHRDGQAE